MSRTCRGHVVDMSWTCACTCRGHVVGMSWTCRGHRGGTTERASRRRTVRQGPYAAADRVGPSAGFEYGVESRGGECESRASLGRRPCRGALVSCLRTTSFSPSLESEVWLTTRNGGQNGTLELPFSFHTPSACELVAYTERAGSTMRMREAGTTTGPVLHFAQKCWRKAPDVGRTGSHAPVPESCAPQHSRSVDVPARAGRVLLGGCGRSPPGADSASIYAPLLLDRREYGGFA